MSHRFKVNQDALWRKFLAILHTGIFFVKDRYFTVQAYMEVTERGHATFIPLYRILHRSISSVFEGSWFNTIHDNC
jgi:hypothetical protein